MKYLSILLPLVLLGCNLTKTVKVPLPPYQSQIVVECYLESGKQIRALVTRTNSFFDTAVVPSPAGREVSIEIDDKVYPLSRQLLLDTIHNKFYNYVGNFYPILKAGARCKIKVIDETNGQELTGETIVMPIVKIDSLFLKFARQDDTLAYLGMYIKDKGGEKNFYRILITSIDSQGKPQKIDFELSDASTDGQTFPIITRPRFLEGKEVTATLYHLSPDYYEFLNTVDDARGFTSGNPFFQPAVVKSNIRGGIGIFTALSYEALTLEVKK